MNAAASHLTPADYLKKILTARVYDVAVESNLEPARALSKRVHNTVLLKREDQQPVFSFKLRGAYNKIAHLSPEQLAKGVICASAGNHAQGVAIAAKRLGIAATIVMPADAPEVKRAATRAAGAEIVDYDRRTESREAIAGALARERGATLVPSFDDVDIIEGQGTAGIEIGEQLGEAPDRVLVCCGGGGLSAGIALALPEAGIVAVEPAGWDDMGRSLRAGTPVPVADDAPPTRCDALQTKLVSPLTLQPLIEQGARAVSVTEDEVEAAMRFAFRELRLVVEPGGAVALAAALAGRAGSLGERSVILLSGGNVDPAFFAEMLGRG